MTAATRMLERCADPNRAPPSAASAAAAMPREARPALRGGGPHARVQPRAARRGARPHETTTAQPQRTLFGAGAAAKSAGDAPPGRATASGVSGSEKRTDRGRPLRFGVARGVAACREGHGLGRPRFVEEGPPSLGKGALSEPRVPGREFGVAERPVPGREAGVRGIASGAAHEIEAFWASRAARPIGWGAARPSTAPLCALLPREGPVHRAPEPR